MNKHIDVLLRNKSHDSGIIEISSTLSIVGNA